MRAYYPYAVLLLAFMALSACSGAPSDSYASELPRLRHNSSDDNHSSGGHSQGHSHGSKKKVKSSTTKSEPAVESHPEYDDDEEPTHTLTAAEAPEVFDGQGQRLGRMNGILPDGESFQLLVYEPRVRGILRIAANGQIKSDVLWYRDDNCKSTPYSANAWLIFKNQERLYMGEVTKRDKFIANSRRYADGTCEPLGIEVFGFEAGDVSSTFAKPIVGPIQITNLTKPQETIDPDSDHPHAH